MWHLVCICRGSATDIWINILSQYSFIHGIHSTQQYHLFLSLPEPSCFFLSVIYRSRWLQRRSVTKGFLCSSEGRCLKQVTTSGQFCTWCFCPWESVSALRGRVHWHTTLQLFRTDTKVRDDSSKRKNMHLLLPPYWKVCYWGVQLCESNLCVLRWRQTAFCFVEKIGDVLTIFLISL